MNEITTIEDILKVRKWEGPKGTIYYFQLLLADGTLGEIGKKKEDAYHIGDSFGPYTVEDGEYGKKLKEVKEEWTGGGGNKGGGKPFSDPKTMILAYAKDVTVAQLNTNWNYETDQQVTDEILTRATAFMEWYEGKSADSVSVPQVLEFDGDTAKPADWVDELVEQRDAGVDNRTAMGRKEAAQTAPQQGGYGPRTKPDKGGAGKPPSAAQMNLLVKVAHEHDVDLDALVQQEWNDIDSSAGLSSWATSFLIDKITGRL